ncbi:MAG TPA: hypothetical protein VFK86_14850 [Bauldia sp.]|nr:hypothetical protein [Bauldia sp.]
MGLGTGRRRRSGGTDRGRAGTPSLMLAWLAAAAAIGLGTALMSGGGNLASPRAPEPATPVPIEPIPAIRVPRRSIERTLWGLAAAILILGIVHLMLPATIESPGLRLYLDLLSLDGEQTLPAWFSATMMAGCGLLMVVAGLVARLREPANAAPWFVLAAAFVYFSLDETTSIHEKIGVTIASLHRFSGILTFAWVVVAAPLLLVALAALVPFLRRLPAPIGRRLFVAGLVFVAGAFGCELIGGYIWNTQGASTLYLLEVIAEEALEMVGLILAIGVVLDYLALVAPRLGLDLAAPDRT